MTALGDKTKNKYTNQLHQQNDCPIRTNKQTQNEQKSDFVKTIASYFFTTITEKNKTNNR